MKTYLAQMLWCEIKEPICIGKNKKRVKSEALKILKKLHGNKSIDRGQAMCSAKISGSDIEVCEIKVID